MKKRNSRHHILSNIRLMLVAMCCLMIAVMAEAAPNASQEFEATKAYQVAEQLYGEDKAQEALSAYQEILKKYPDTELKNDILMRMAQCYSQLGDDDSAIKIYLKFVSDDPNSPEAAQAISLIMNLYSERYQFDEITAMSKQLAQQLPGTEAAAMALYRVASYLYSQEQFKDAIREYENFIDQYPNSTMKFTVFSRLIYLYIKEGTFDKAELLLKNRLDQTPTDPYMLRQLATVYQKQGQYDQALRIYQQVLEMNPNDIDVYEQLGELYVEKGDTEKALAEWAKITESAPGQYSRHQLLAHILKSHGFYDQATVEYEKAIELQPMFSYIYTQLADLYIIRKQFNSALDVYLKALQKFHLGQSGREEIMTSMLELCDLEELYDRVASRLLVLASEPDNIQAFMTLADVYFHSGKFDDALQFLKKVALLYPDQGMSLFDRAQNLEREMRFDHAISYYQALLDLFPESGNSEYATLHIGQLKYRLNHYDSAIVSLRDLISRSSYKNSFWLSAYILIGDIYLEQKKDVQTALSTYLEAKHIVETRSEYISAFYSQILELDLKIAECYRLIENYDAAENILDLIQARDQTKSTLARLSKLRGDCFFSRGDFDKALIQYQEAVRWPMNEDWVNDSLDRIALIKEYLDQNAAEIIKLHAQVERLRKLGQYEEALKLCLSASTDRLKLEAGALLALLMRVPESKSIYEQIIQSKSPFAPEAMFRIASLYLQQLNDREQAIKSYSALIENYPGSVLVAEARKQIRLLASEKPTDKHIP